MESGPLKDQDNTLGQLCLQHPICGQIPSKFPKLVWRVKAPPGPKVFVWLLLQNSLWTAACLQLHGWKNNYFCVLCERNLETVTHLFIECPFLAKSLGSCSNLEQRSKLISITLDDREWYGRLVLPHDGSRYEDGTPVDNSDPMVYMETKKSNDLWRLQNNSTSAFLINEGYMLHLVLRRGKVLSLLQIQSSVPATSLPKLEQPAVMTLHCRF
jgi:hypothetical protein